MTIKEDEELHLHRTLFKIENNVKQLTIRVQFLESILLELMEEVFPEEVLQDSLDAIRRIHRDLKKLRDADDTC
jgi:hypothetical protein